VRVYVIETHERFASASLIKKEVVHVSSRSDFAYEWCGKRRDLLNNSGNIGWRFAIYKVRVDDWDNFRNKKLVAYIESTT